MRIKWNSVTRSSKLLAMILFIALPFVGFFLGTKYGYHWANYRISTYIAARQGVFLPGLELTRSQLIEAKTRLAISDIWQIRPQDVFRDFEKPNKFYFVIPQTNPAEGAALAMYDLAWDVSYGKYEVVKPSLERYSVSYLSRQYLSEDRELRIVGIRGKDLVFRESFKDETLGKCASAWLYQDLESVNVSQENPERRPYTLSGGELRSVQKEVTDCLEIAEEAGIDVSK